MTTTSAARTTTMAIRTFFIARSLARSVLFLVVDQHAREGIFGAVGRQVGDALRLTAAGDLVETAGAAGEQPVEGIGAGQRIERETGVLTDQDLVADVERELAFDELEAGRSQQHGDAPVERSLAERSDVEQIGTVQHRVRIRSEIEVEA